MQMSPLSVNHGQRVSRFVSDNYSGVYCTRYVSTDDGVDTYVTYLHSPDGEVIFTNVHPDGSMTDVSRKG